MRGVNAMDEMQKVQILGEGARDDMCTGCGAASNLTPDDMGRYIYLAVRSDGRRIPLLKILLSNACENDCFYCANRRDRNVHRTHFRPEELAHIFDDMQRRGLVRGIFLSSGIAGRAQRVMERMISTIEIIRGKYEFRGYVHLKILPGVDEGSVRRAVELADRVSVNLEAPSPQRLTSLSHRKNFSDDLLTRMKWAHEAIRTQPTRRVTQTTQLVVGAAGETDREILNTTAGLYRQLDLRRVYYSAFHPVPDTPLEGHPATPAWRGHRLYQADFLLREYGFQPDELCFDEKGDLPRQTDPKLLWALRHPERFPVEINRADRHTLIRVPGIGPVSARRIVRLRRQGRFHELTELKPMGVVVTRAAPFILLDGKRPLVQLSLLELHCHSSPDGGGVSITVNRPAASNRLAWSYSGPA